MKAATFMQAHENNDEETAATQHTAPTVWPPQPLDMTQVAQDDANALAVHRISRSLSVAIGMSWIMIIAMSIILAVSISQFVMLLTGRYEFWHGLVQFRHWIGIVYYCAVLAALVGVAFWFFCAYANLEKLNEAKSRFLPGMATALVLFPFVNIFMMHSIFTELWKESRYSHSEADRLADRFIRFLVGVCATIVVADILQTSMLRQFPAHGSHGLMIAYFGLQVIAWPIAILLQELSIVGMKRITAEQIRSGELLALQGSTSKASA